ncbi:MAG: hypothetical protein ABWY11_09700, partial [Umezawaea sp.]
GQGKAKRLVLNLGTGHSIAAHLRSVKVRYTRFTRAGVPCRAVVTLTVVAASDEPPGRPKPTGAPVGGGKPPRGGTPAPRGGHRAPGRSATTDDLPARGSAEEDALLKSFRTNAASAKGGRR